jgi:hypothetical protein
VPGVSDPRDWIRLKDPYDGTWRYVRTCTWTTPEREDSFMADEFEGMSEERLREECVRRSLPVGGDMLTRLREHDEGRWAKSDDEIRTKYHLPGAPFVLKRPAGTEGG